MNLRYFIGIFALLNALASFSFSEESLGRGADGRAYRVTPDGLQIVDEFAELEVTVHEQARRIAGLETEIQDKLAVIDNLKAEKIQCPVCPKPQKIPVQNCANLVEPYKLENFELKARLDSATHENSVLKGAKSEDTEICEELRERDRLKLVSLLSEQEKLLGKVKDLESHLRQVSLEKETLSAQKAQVSPVQTALAPVQKPKTNNNKVLDQLLRDLQTLVSKREKLLRSYQAQSRAISFKPASLRTPKGVVFDSKTKAKARSASFNEQQFYIREFSFIKRMVTQDIELLERLNRIR